MIGTLLLALVAAAGTEDALTVGVLPAGGNAPAPVRAKATDALVSALRAIPSLRVVAMSDVAGLLGPGAKDALAACNDDACRADVVKPLQAARLVIAELFSAPGGMSFEVRLVDPAKGAEPLVRVSRDVKTEDDLALAAGKAASDLFRDRAGSEGRGKLILSVTPDGAAIAVDGAPAAIAPAPPLEVRAGKHTVRATAKGHRPGEVTVDVPLGASASAELDLEKRRSRWPLLLAGAGVVAAGTGVVFGVLAKGTASDWSDACGNGNCPAGYTRERYADDESKLSVQRGLANGLIGAGAALAVGALVWFFADPGSDE